MCFLWAIVYLRMYEWVIWCLLYLLYLCVCATHCSFNKLRKLLPHIRMACISYCHTQTNIFEPEIPIRHSTCAMCRPVRRYTLNVYEYTQTSHTVACVKRALSVFVFDVSKQIATACWHFKQYSEWTNTHARHETWISIIHTHTHTQQNWMCYWSYTTLR